jgi:type I restriction-modification system DNA methylase subunit
VGRGRRAALRANSKLKASEYGTPVLGLIFLRFAEVKFNAARERIEARASTRRKVGPSDYQAERVIYLPDQARFDCLLGLPEGADLGRAVNEAMRVVEEHNPDLAGVLPRTYISIENTTIASLLRHINSYTKDLEGDAFGLIYEYFLGKFALAEGSAREIAVDLMAEMSERSVQQRRRIARRRRDEVSGVGVGVGVEVVLLQREELVCFVAAASR